MQGTLHFPRRKLCCDCIPLEHNRVIPSELLSLDPAEDARVHKCLRCRNASATVEERRFSAV